MSVDALIERGAVEELSRPGVERCFQLNDPDGSAIGFVVVDSTRRGAAFGGVRRNAYLTADLALEDATRLARSMTYKSALAGLPAGGGKAVLIWRPGERHHAAYALLGQLLEALDGAFVCGPDVGTGDAEIETLRLNTTHVNPPQNNPAASTARGVLSALRAASSVAFHQPGWTNLTTAIQGLGSVGLSVARHLIRGGAAVLGADVREAKAEAARWLGVRIMPPKSLLEEPCDILVPCALGGLITQARVPTLRCQAICGPANNILSDDDVADALLARDILFVPDILVSAGAVVEGVFVLQYGESVETRAGIEHALSSGIQRTCQAILEEAETSSESPHHVAVRRALEVLSE